MPDFRDKVILEDVYVRRATAKAVLIECEGDEIWVPQSQIDDESEAWQEGDAGDMVVSEWWARQKGLV